MVETTLLGRVEVAVMVVEEEEFERPLSAVHPISATSTTMKIMMLMLMLLLGMMIWRMSISSQLVTLRLYFEGEEEMD